MTWLQPSYALSRGIDCHPMPKNRPGLPPCECLTCVMYRRKLKELNEAFWDNMGASEEAINNPGPN